MPWECSAYKFMMASPEDVSGLESLIEQGNLAAPSKTGCRRLIPSKSWC